MRVESTKFPSSLSSSAPTSLPAAEPVWGAAPSPISPENASLHSIFAPGKPTPCCGHLLSPGTQWLGGPSPHHTKTSVLCAHQTPTRDHKHRPLLRKKQQSTSQMVVSLWVLEIHLFSWKNKELIHWHQRAKPRNRTGATQWEGSQTQQQIKGEKKTKDDYYYLTALRLCLFWAEAAAHWGAQEPRGLCWGTWPCSCQALPSSRAALGNSLAETAASFVGVQSQPWCFAINGFEISFHIQQCVA